MSDTNSIDNSDITQQMREELETTREDFHQLLAEISEEVLDQSSLIQPGQSGKCCST